MEGHILDNIYLTKKYLDESTWLLYSVMFDNLLT